MQIPFGHQVIMPYLILDNADLFVNFIQEVFNAEVSFCIRREDEISIRHAEIHINGGTLMLASSMPDLKKETGYLFIYVPDANTTYKKAIDAGCEIIRELQKEDYGLTAGIKDPFGNVWWITSVN